MLYKNLDPRNPKMKAEFGFFCLNAHCVSIYKYYVIFHEQLDLLYINYSLFIYCMFIITIFITRDNTIAVKISSTENQVYNTITITLQKSVFQNTRSLSNILSPKNNLLLFEIPPIFFIYQHQ